VHETASDHGSTRRVFRVAGIVGIGVGAALIGVGAGMSVRAHQASDQVGGLFASGGTWTDDYAQVEQSGRTAYSASIALYVVGGVVAATGVVLTTLGFLPERKARAMAKRGWGLSCAF
jgi:hypothetical protein